MSKYYEALKDPRWQKKRLEIMQRDGFRCTKCADTFETLSVHHLYYISGRDPWAYPDFCYSTLCETCHGLVKQEHADGCMEPWEAALNNIFDGGVGPNYALPRLAMGLQVAYGEGNPVPMFERIRDLNVWLFYERHSIPFIGEWLRRPKDERGLVPLPQLEWEPTINLNLYSNSNQERAIKCGGCR